MQRYRNLDGSSGVAAYRIGDGFIEVRFVDGGTYRYDHTTPGASDVAAMQEHARAGRGLATYINQHVRDRYSARLD
jgi:hypothetical protein